MTLLNGDNSLVLIIDIQEKLLNAVFNKQNLEKKAAITAKAANILKIPVIVTEQYPKGLGKTVPAVKNSLFENSLIFEKNTFSALDNSDILNAIKSSGKKQTAVLGIETHICVGQTAISLAEAGFEVYVLGDACGSRTEEEHRAGLKRMQGEGVSVITAEIALFEWLKGSKHPNFKEVQALIK